MKTLHVIGGGLAGSEAAWQSAERGVHVILHEMRPLINTGAHISSDLAELICSNSLGSKLIDRPTGLLLEELRLLGSLLVDCAQQTAVPAGGALAVDRKVFARLVTERVSKHPNIEVQRGEVVSLPPSPAIISTGPLTSPAFSAAIATLTGQENLFFFDAIAPLVDKESIDMSIAFQASRFLKGDREEGDYINCPLNEAEYNLFVNQLCTAEQFPVREFEQDLLLGVRAGAGHFFERCLPVEEHARRGLKTLSFGPLRPVGLRDPRTGQRPFAVVQLRQDDLLSQVFNLVGFQTNLIQKEQQRVFRLIPGLENVTFHRYGQMHRNTYILAPALLRPTLQLRKHDDLFFAGQICGVEGYMGNIATGWLAGFNAVRILAGDDPIILPETTMLGALCRYISSEEPAHFQPMKANFGLLPSLRSSYKTKLERAREFGSRSMRDLSEILKVIR